MTTMLRKAAISTIAAAALATGITATATPSSAAGWHGGYGWRGRGWHGGHGWYGGGRGGGWYGGYGWGAPVAAGVLGGLALGALAGSAYAYGPGYYGYYGTCNVQNRPTYDGWGNFVGYQPVQVCY